MKTETINMHQLKTYFNWSTGKDCSLALHYLLLDKNYNVAHLLTSVNKHHNRVSMHGLKRSLLQQQVDALDIPFSTIELPEEPSMEEYEVLMRQTVQGLQQQGFDCAAFGDIFLEDLKKYREQQLATLNIKTVFPLWKRDTKQLLGEFIELGFKAILVCINADLLDPSFAGRIIDEQFIKDLPPGVDPCGEYGEFHTFCFDGPIFKKPIRFEVGEKIYREYKRPESNASDQAQKSNIGFWFCDLMETV
jgi:uncharacterized protein (TIGR00290 family)